VKTENNTIYRENPLSLAPIQPFNPSTLAPSHLFLPVLVGDIQRSDVLELLHSVNRELVFAPLQKHDAEGLAERLLVGWGGWGDGVG
jgi:hypothetical protein